MSAGRLNLVIEQGATFSQQLLWQTGSVPTNVNLTGYTADMQIRQFPEATSAILYELSTTSGGIVLGGSAGTIQLTIDAADTEAMTFTEAVYDLKLTSGTGVVTRLVKGNVYVSPAVTQ